MILIMNVWMLNSRVVLRIQRISSTSIYSNGCHFTDSYWRIKFLT